jgi:PAS domain S-box-containing protein
MGWETTKHIKERSICENNEEGASEQDDRYRFLAEHSSDVLYELDAHLYFSYISPLAEELFGYSAGDFKAYNLFEAIEKVVYPQDIDLIKEQIRKRLNGDCETEIDDFRIYTNSGQLKWVQVRATYIPNNSGRPQKIIGNMRDITSRKQLEDKMNNYEKSPVS